MTWASDGGEGGQRRSDKTWWRVGFIKEKLQCSCDKTFKGKTSNDRTVAQLVSLNSQFPENRSFRARGLQRSSGVRRWSRSIRRTLRLPSTPPLHLSDFIFDYSVKSPRCVKPARLLAVSRESDLFPFAFRPLPGTTSHYLTKPKCSFPFKKLSIWHTSFLSYYIMLVNAQEIRVLKVNIEKAWK